MINKDIELLAPAGDIEKLKFAIRYGADAVYLAGNKYGLRAQAGNFTIDELNEATKYAHNYNVKVYVTINIYAHNRDLLGLEEYLHELEKIGVDALIIADPGIYRIIQKNKIDIPIHISTQATTVNWSNVAFWSELNNVSRVVLARELSIQEIEEIKRNVPQVELESFIHGAMCISYSGRCLLSNYMAGRDANLGACAQPCRWKYALVEQTRPDEYYPIDEDQYGSYIFNSNDLCLIDNINDIISAGVTSLKIEGRMKSSFYVATVVRAYRAVLDSLIHNHDLAIDHKYWRSELNKIFHREYTKGFYFSHETNSESTIELNSTHSKVNYEFVGIVTEYDESTQIAIIEERNKVTLGDQIEIISPNYKQNEFIITELINSDNQYVDCINKPKDKFKIKLPFKAYPMDILRKKIVK